MAATKAVPKLIFSAFKVRVSSASVKNCDHPRLLERQIRPDSGIRMISTSQNSVMPSPRPKPGSTLG